MKRRLQLTYEAIQDLDDIWDYIAENSPRNADRYIDRLRRRMERVCENPLALGNPRDYLVPGLRGVLEGSLIIFYRVFDDRIEVIRILHQQQDHPRHFD